MRLTRLFLLLGLLMAILFSAFIVIPVCLQESSLPPINQDAMLTFLAISVGLLICYLFGFKRLVSQGNNQPLLKIIIAFSVLFCVILILIPQVGSGDIYNYILRARVLTEHGENPYLTTTSTVPDDLFYIYSPKMWHEIPMQYGPVLASVSIATSWLARDSFLVNQLLLKILFALIHMANIVLIVKLTRLIKPAMGNIPLFLYAWNPLVLFEVANNAHNDILMAFLILLSLYFYYSKKYVLVWPVLLLSVFTKYVTLLLFPLLIYFVLKKIPREKVKTFIIKGALICLALTALLFAPFWEGFQTLKSLLMQTELYSFANLSLVPMLIFGATELFSNIYPISYKMATVLVRLTAFTAFFVLYLFLLYRIFKTQKKDVTFYSFLILFLYTIVGVTSLQPWYFLWVIPIAALIDRRLVWGIIFFITALGLFSYTFVLMSILFLVMFLIVVFLGMQKKWNIINIVRNFFLYEETIK